MKTSFVYTIAVFRAYLHNINLRCFFATVSVYSKATSAFEVLVPTAEEAR